MNMHDVHVSNDSYYCEYVIFNITLDLLCSPLGAPCEGQLSLVQQQHNNNNYYY